MTDTPLIVIGALALALCIAGILEYQFHMRSLAVIPLRIHVNGTRGKSSVTGKQESAHLPKQQAQRRELLMQMGKTELFTGYECHPLGNKRGY